MQDSLEDYLKIAGVGKDKKINNERLASIKATLECKKRAEDYAQRIVEVLIEGKLQPQIFLKSLNCINEDLYEDVVDERSITKLCGYPICGKTIPAMPEKKYIILAKVNKVFDLTDRKKYCSNFCYKASTHIKKQIDNSPLWLRKSETIYEYNLLPFTNAGLSPGEEVVNSIKTETHTEPDKEDDDNFTSITAFTEACLGEAEDNLPDDDPDKYNNGEVKLTEENILNEISKTGKSILKQQQSMDECIQQDGEVPSTSNCSNVIGRKKVKFIDNIIETPAKKANIQKEKEELKASVENICKAFNINLDLNKGKGFESNNLNCVITSSEDNLEKEVKQSSMEQSDRNIKIDYNKMNNIIRKVNETERMRNKQPILIDIAPKASPFPKMVIEPTPPKYAERIIAIANKTLPKLPITQDKDMYTIIDKVKTLELSKKRKVNEEDEKMRKILEKIQKKNTVEKKSQVIMVDTLVNPEVHRSQIEQAAKTTAATSKNILRIEECAQITRAFQKWLTVETFVFLYGEKKIRQMVSNEQLDSYFTTLKIAELETSKQLKYFEICRRLQLKEIQDEKFDSGCMDAEENSRSSLKPVPQYETLKEEVEAMNLKAHAFYSGQIVVNAKSLDEQVDMKKKEDVVLPLVEVSNTIALRRSVFIKSVSQYINNHLYEMALPESTLLTVQSLIKTFKLDANNVVFKPTQWNTIALILINCLKKKEEDLISTKCQEYFEKFNKRFPNSNDLLTACTAIVEKFDTFIEGHILDNN